MGGFRGVFPIEDGEGVEREGGCGVENGDGGFVCGAEWGKAV